MSSSPLKDGAPLELDPAYGEKFAQDYNRKVGILAWDVAQLLKKLEAERQQRQGRRRAQRRPKRPSIWPNAVMTARRAREILEGDLRRHGYTVLPDQQLPRDEADYRRGRGAPLGALPARHPSGGRELWRRARWPQPKNRWWCCKMSSPSNGARAAACRA